MKTWDDIKNIFGDIQFRDPEEITAEKKRAHDRQRALRKEEIIKTIPKLYIDSGIMNYREELYAEYNLFNESDKLIFWIYGGTGTGKTYLANSIKIKRYMESCGKMAIIKEHDINYDIVDRLKSSLICIDDVGRTSVPGRCVSLLSYYYEIIDHKVEHKKKMIVTSNYEPLEWLHKMGKYGGGDVGPIGSRLSGITYSNNLTGKDRRGKA